MKIRFIAKVINVKYTVMQALYYFSCNFKEHFKWLEKGSLLKAQQDFSALYCYNCKSLHHVIEAQATW